jgi:hypothetical protein
MWVLVAVFVTGFNISTQQIGFYETEAECMADQQKIVRSDVDAFEVFGKCLPSQGVSVFE